MVVNTLEEAIEQLKRDPGQPVRTRVGDLTIEMRAIPEDREKRTAADVFRDIGPWEGESTEEILALLSEARERSGQRQVPDL